MTCKELISILQALNPDAEIVLGVQGYLTEYNAEDEIRVNQTGQAVYITDFIHYDEIDR